ncbi:hypothetical protein DICVIV_02972 [Dictyocaulus viviparus]|uniref:RanBD1 domain-containing protein n=1 Tax=Dictyocaulus viviparus TaxID=29172 RepID=A0A0D8Y3S0_DICVI|nr:hypothetical protein DICVIV_02972 [Dictyocaulus viviparus]
MAVDEFKQTSEQHMRTLQFNDKVSRLNREFIRQLQEWYKECAHYDFSNSVKSYLEHIKRLDEMYFGKAVSKDVSNAPQKADRKIAKAKRRVADAPTNNELDTSVNISTSSNAPMQFSFGGATSATKPNKDDASATSAVGNSTSGNLSRKRAIRGGGPAGGAETIVFRGKDTSEVPVIKPIISNVLPKPTPGFWSTQKKDDCIGASKPAVDFGLSKKSDVSETHEKKTVSSPPFKKESLFFFEKKKDDGSESPSASTKTINKDEIEKKQTLSFPSFSSTNDKDKGGQKPTLTSFSFGNTTTSNAPSGGLTFSFGTLPKSSTEGEKVADDDGEYVPPKAEVVEVEEADAFFSTKCSVFKLIDKQYSKIGVGMLYLKEVDGKKSVLVRAATAIGTVWINALMNKTMKVAKVDEKGEKIRVRSILVTFMESQDSEIKPGYLHAIPYV